MIGDLAFFYDMNAMRLRHIKNNVHILLINNEGGSEFYFNHMWKDEASDLHTTARHHTKAETIRRSKEFIKATIGQEKAQKIAGLFKK